MPVWTSFTTGKICSRGSAIFPWLETGTTVKVTSFSGINQPYRGRYEPSRWRSFPMDTCIPSAMPGFPVFDWMSVFPSVRIFSLRFFRGSSSAISFAAAVFSAGFQYRSFA